jgi:hypothetical protein
MSNLIDDIKPFNFNEWLNFQKNILPENQESLYLNYLKNWLLENKQKKEISQKTFKDEYIQLLKDLSFLFGVSEFDNFLTDFDNATDEDLIHTIPFFAKKLKQIAIILSKKRESVKQAKLKYNLIGSNDGLEKILYEYILKSFTKKENNITQVPLSKFSNLFPDLSSTKKTFFIEIEELHDKKTYLGLDEKQNIENYFGIDKIKDNLNLNSFSNLSESDIKNLISSQFLSRISDSFLSNALNEFLNITVPTLTTDDQFNLSVLNFYNQIEASKKYIGESLYGLSAIRLKDLNVFDNNLVLDINPGNNWFYWPSSARILDTTQFNNTFLEIPINESNFINSGATAGDDYSNSDLIFTDKNGIVEGAWLRGTYDTKPEKLDMKLSIKSGDKKEFIFPFPGIIFSKKTGGFLGYSITDDQNNFLEKIDSKIKENILSNYYTSELPLSSCNPIYLNNTTLIQNGAKAEIFSTNADNIIKKIKRIDESTNIYSESIDGEIQQSYLYKFNKTDIPISIGINNVYWPLQRYESEENISLTLNDKCCLPVYLKDINPSKCMVGAVAGFNFDTSDVIYKFGNRDSDPMEAAWLGSPSISRLDMMNNAISIYNGLSATKCAQYVDGPIQGSLSFKVLPSEKISFIWMDEDTFADDVFKYTPHLPTCSYLDKFPHDYYGDQDYQNLEPINDIKHWQKCTCKSVFYSPIGHSGEKVYDFNGMADYLFADPDGLGEDFALNSWSDTRGFGVTNSPQFAFYQLDDINADINVGWGAGKWKTGTDKKMILKTGRRYTYYRNSLRTNTGETPYFIAKYAYKNINGLLGTNDGFDLVIIIDNSRSQSLNIEQTKSSVISIIDKILSTNKNVQISLIEFNTVANRLSYLSNERDPLKLFVSQIKTPTDSVLYNTNILNALTMAQSILTEKVEIIDEDSLSLSTADLCSRLNFSVVTGAIGSNILNNPQSNKPKKILFFSDGVDEILSPENIILLGDNVNRTEIPYEEKELISLKNLSDQTSENFKKLILQKEKLLLDNQKNLNALLTNDDTLNNLKNSLNTQLKYFEKQLIDLNLQQSTIKSKDFSVEINETNKSIQNLKIEINSITSSTQNDINSYSNKSITVYQTIKNYIIRYLKSLNITTNEISNRINDLVFYIENQKTLNNNELRLSSLQNVLNEVTTLTSSINEIKKQISIELLDSEKMVFTKISSNVNDNFLATEILNLKTKYDSLIVDARNNKLNLFLIDNNIKKLTTTNISIINYADKIKKENDIQIYTVDIGYRSKDTELMEKMASTFSAYFNLQNFLENGDGDLNGFIDYITMRIYGTMPVIPNWYKAVRDQFGNWSEKYDELGNLEISDMQLRPGDYISYVHKNNIFYSNDDNPQVNFAVPCLSFTINAKLNGWDYETNTFSSDFIGEIYGARPFWADVYVRPNTEQNFNKENIAFGGKIKFFDEYVPIQQPEVSKMFLATGDILEYQRNKQTLLNWSQPISLFTTLSTLQWCKLNFNIEFSNLKDFLYKEPLDGILTASMDASDMILESYSVFKPAFYNYYARNFFTYEQGMLNKKRCENSFVVYNTSVILEASNPYENLYNNFYPSVASVSMVYDVVPEKQICYYHLPETLGHSFYRGRGYEISLDNDKLSEFKTISAETTFFDVAKYGPRNRGLTKNDQTSISKIDNISTSWIYEPYSSSERAGVISSPPENQKFIPYQSTYEITKKNNYGIIRQTDEFQFWNPKNPPVWNAPEYPLTYRKEIGLESYLNRKQKLLVNKGKLQNWRNDIFGSDYGLYKLKTPINFGDMECWYKAEYGVLKNHINGYLFDENDTADDNDLIVRWVDKASRRRDLFRFFGRPKYIEQASHSKPALDFNRFEALDVLKNLFEINSPEISLFVMAKFNEDFDGRTKTLLSMGEPMSAASLSTFNNASLAISMKSYGLSFDFGNITDENSIEIKNENFDLDLNQYHLFEMYFNKPHCYAYVDGELFGVKENALNKNIYATQGLWLASFILGTLSTACEISEVILYKKYFIDRDKRFLRDYFKRSYNFI